MENLWMGLVVFWAHNPEQELTSVFVVLIYMQKYKWCQKKLCKWIKKNPTDLLDIVDVSIEQSSGIAS